MWLLSLWAASAVAPPWCVSCNESRSDEGRHSRRCAPDRRRCDSRGICMAFNPCQLSHPFPIAAWQVEAPQSEVLHLNLAETQIDVGLNWACGCSSLESNRRPPAPQTTVLCRNVWKTTVSRNDLHEKSLSNQVLFMSQAFFFQIRSLFAVAAVAKGLT